VDLFSDYLGLVREIESRRVYTLAVTNLPEAYALMSKKISSSRFVRTGLGLHPMSAQEPGALLAFQRYLPEAKYVGEVGLDGTARDPTPQQQEEAFRSIIKLCREAGDKVLSVHSRRAETRVVDLIGRGYPGRVILHWYTGGAGTLERAMDMGFFFSVNPAMLRSDRGRSLILRMDPSRVLTESDGPFVRVRGRPAGPADMATLATELASLWDVPTPTAQQRLLDNFRALLADPPV
jgi:TatD DNase family protein